MPDLAAANLLQQFTEGVVLQTGISDDVSHGNRVDGILTRNRDRPNAVCHHDVAALPFDPKTGLLQRADRILVVDAREFGHDQTSTTTARRFARWSLSWIAAR